MTGWDFADFKAKDKEYFDRGLRLVGLRVRSGKFTGVWHPGSGAQWWVPGSDYAAFKAQDKLYFDQGLRLVDIEYHDGKWTGVWRPGTGAQWWVPGWDYDAFKAQDKTYFDEGLRLVCLRVNNGKYTGVWRPGSGPQWWVPGWDHEAFKDQDKKYFDEGLRLVDLEVHDGKFTGVWRPGTGAQWWYFGDDYEMFRARDLGHFDDGLRLRKVFPYPSSCDSECLNQVVMPTSTYNYEITRTSEHCPGLPGTCGSPGPGEVVTYHWPCLTFDGSKRYARLSALSYNDAPLFTLPFSDTEVKELGPWLYQPGSWHHAIDFQRADRASFDVLAAAPGRVIFTGWDWWSGNTIVISHESGGVQDAFRTIYMHLRNGPTHDADQSWNITVPNLKEPRLTQFKNYLKNTGCPKGGPYTPKPEFWGSDQDKIKPSLLGSVVAAGVVIAHSGCTGPGGCGCTQDPVNGWTWGGTPNTHLHVFFARRDPTDNQWYFIDPYGIYSSGGCYPALDTPITTPCARYPIAWKGHKAAYP
ncbi:MAG TPA: M23 family metallopeptidase [Gaiellaceae bacterium]|nr:M23 family metallopeptidase [Gaiellaceae bacterium]